MWAGPAAADEVATSTITRHKSHQLFARARAKSHRVAHALSSRGSSRSSSAADPADVAGALGSATVTVDGGGGRRRRRAKTGRPPSTAAAAVGAAPDAGGSPAGGRRRAAAAAAAAARRPGRSIPAVAPPDLPQVVVNGRDLAAASPDGSGVAPGLFFRGAAPRLQSGTSALSAVATFVDLRTEEERSEERREAVAAATAAVGDSGGVGGGNGGSAGEGAPVVVPFLPRRIGKPLPANVYLDVRRSRGRRRKQKALGAVSAAAAADGERLRQKGARGCPAAAGGDTSPVTPPAPAAASVGPPQPDAGGSSVSGDATGGGRGGSGGSASSTTTPSTDSELSARDVAAVEAAAAPPGVAAQPVWVSAPLMASWRIGRALVRPFGRREKVQCMARAAANLRGGRERIVSEMDGRGLLGLNKILVDEGGEGVTAALRIVAAATPPVLLFCTAGKDRTGLVSALLLSLAGVDEEAIAADYAASEETYLGGGEAQAWYASRLGLVGLGLEEWMASPASVMRDTFAYIRERYGTVTAYLTSAGFGPAEQHALRIKLRQ